MREGAVMAKRKPKRDIRAEQDAAIFHDSAFPFLQIRAFRTGFHRYTVLVRETGPTYAKRFEAWVFRGGWRSSMWSRKSTFAPDGAVECVSPLDGAVGATPAEAVSRARRYTRAWVRMQLARDLQAEAEAWSDGTWEERFYGWPNPLDGSNV